MAPLEVREDGRGAPLGTGRQRALLALLLVHANELVSSERLIEELWSGRPPPSAPKALQGYVSQLRRSLPTGTILTRGQGYVLVATGTDAGEFERLTKLAVEQDPNEAVLTLQRAFALWRGRPLEEFEYEEWAQLEIARLHELRLAATEQTDRNGAGARSSRPAGPRTGDPCRRPSFARPTTRAADDRALPLRPSG